MRRFILPALIIIFGLLSVITLTSIAPSLASRQLIFFIVGLVVFFIAAKIPFSRYVHLSPALFLGLNGLLIFTLLFGTLTRNTARWIAVGDLFVIQPSQLGVPLTALFLLYWLRQKDLRNALVFLKALSIIFIPAFLILIEPDLDTTIVFLATLGVTIWLHDTKLKHLLLLGLGAVIISGLTWQFVLRDYQKERFTSFIAGAQQTDSVHYNAQQALIAVGSGQFTGTGLGQGIQSHLRFLPERQTDFIFASIAEEYGFVGSLLIIGLYGGIISFCIYIGFSSATKEASLFCYTLAAQIFFQATVNISMNLGLIPIAGLTLPLLSYGGSSILSLIASLGIVQSLARVPRNKLTLHIS